MSATHLWPEGQRKDLWHMVTLDPYISYMQLSHNQKLNMNAVELYLMTTHTAVTFCTVVFICNLQSAREFAWKENKRLVKTPT